MREAALFFKDYIVPCPQPVSFYRVPSQSPENFFKGGAQPVSICIAASMDLELIHNLLTNCLEASTVPGIDEDKREKWKNILGETILTTAYRETYEETGQIPLALFDTGKRLSIQCKKYEFHVSVFSGLIPHNSPIKLNYENIDYTYLPTVFSPCHIEIPEQKKNQIFCINKAREMHKAMMN